MKNSCSGIKEDWCCKGKSFVYCQVFESFCPGILKLLPLQGALLIAIIPRAMPWARSFCPFRACCLRLACVLLLLFPSAEEIKLLKAEM